MSFREENKKIAAIVLAAGLSSRMGTFKPLLPVGNDIAILRSINNLNKSGVRDIIIVTGQLNFKDRVNMPTNVSFAHNPDYKDGMFSSVLTGVKALADDLDGFFVLPADCCAVSSDELGLLIDELRDCVVIPSFAGRRGHPPLFPIRCAKDILTYEGGDGLKGIRNEMPKTEIKMPTAGTILDMDTPEDYALLLSFLGIPTYPSKDESIEILKKHNASDEIIEHGKHVAKVALYIAKLINEKGAEINTGLLEASCLLHDLVRFRPNHAELAKQLLLEMGYPDAAIVVGKHMDIDGPCNKINEALLLYLADKLCRRGQLVPLDKTLREMGKKFPTESEAYRHAEIRMSNAKAIASLLQHQYRISYEDISRYC